MAQRAMASTSSSWSILLYAQVAERVAEFAKYNWEDPLNLESLLTEEEIAVR